MMKTKIIVLISCLGISGIIWLATTLSEYHDYSFVTSPKLVYLPEGVAPTNNLPEEITIKFRAQGWKLLSLLTGEKPSLELRVSNSATYQKLYTKNVLKENKWFSPEFSVISVMPEEIELVLDKRISKKVPVSFNGNITFKPGFGLARKVLISPDSVLISGSFRTLSKIDSIFTKAIELRDLAEYKEFEVELENKNLYSSQELVKVIFDVQQIVEKEFKTRSVEIKDLPPDRNVLLIPSSVDVVLRGGIKELAKLDTSAVKVFLSYSDLLTAVGDQINVKVDIPEDFSIVSISPEKIKFIIKKY